MNKTSMEIYLTDAWEYYKLHKCFSFNIFVTWVSPYLSPTCAYMRGRETKHTITQRLFGKVLKLVKGEILSSKLHKKFKC